MKYTLVCDSEKKNWPDNENLYYLGYWCLEKTDQSFKNLGKLKIINNEERNDNQTKEDLKIINDLYYALIDDLTAFLNKLHKTGRVYIILTTARDVSARDVTVQQLAREGVRYDDIIFGLPHCNRTIINDYGSSNPYPTCDSVNIPRNSSDLERFLKDLGE